MWALRAILIVFVIVCVVAFAYHNSSPAEIVNVDLIFAKYIEVPLVIVVFWSFMSGLLVSLLIFILVYLRQSVQIHGLHKHVRALESEVTALRNRPIEESAELLKGEDEKAAGVNSTLVESEDQ
ncbi:MAG: LapA family protein [candidate division Zixibacteria bacterium]|nr:LapA family protein [candidate division Zixibacteria bacterium]